MVYICFLFVCMSKCQLGMESEDFLEIWEVGLCRNSHIHLGSFSLKISKSTVIFHFFLNLIRLIFSVFRDFDQFHSAYILTHSVIFFLLLFVYCVSMPTQCKLYHPFIEFNSFADFAGCCLF